MFVPLYFVQYRHATRLQDYIHTETACRSEGARIRDLCYHIIEPPHIVATLAAPAPSVSRSYLAVEPPMSSRNFDDLTPWLSHRDSLPIHRMGPARTVFRREAMRDSPYRRRSAHNEVIREE